MNIIKNNFFLELKKEVYFFFILFVGLSSIIITNYVYIYEIDLSRQDSRNYILLAENFNNYFFVQNQVAMRILPSLLAGLLYKLQIFDIFSSFRFLSYFFFIMLLFKVFNFFLKFRIKPSLAFSFMLILIYQNHSVLYSIFNPYLLTDILVYFFSICTLEASVFKKKKKLFIFSILLILTKEYTVLLVVSAYIYYYFSEKHDERFLFFSLITIMITYIINYKMAGSLNAQDQKLNYLITEYFFDYRKYFSNSLECLIEKKNIFLLFPFLLFFLSKNFLFTIKKFYPFIIYSFFPILISILIFSEIGNNFFRVYYQGYFIWVIFALVYLNLKFSDNILLQNILFFSPALFLLDFIFIFYNFRQHGFFSFFQETRYSYISSFYLFNLIITTMLLMKWKKIKN